jgi:hypothetical protein
MSCQALPVVDSAQKLYSKDEYCVMSVYQPKIIIRM